MDSGEGSQAPHKPSQEKGSVKKCSLRFAKYRLGVGSCFDYLGEVITRVGGGGVEKKDWGQKRKRNYAMLCKS